jgi:hypothetical protein
MTIKIDNVLPNHWMIGFTVFSYPEKTAIILGLGKWAINLNLRRKQNANTN